MRLGGYTGNMMCVISRITYFSLLSIVFISLTLTVVLGAQNDDEAALAVVETEDIEEQVPDGVGIKFASDSGDPNIEVFKPTKEWQTVKKDQPIPRGLHVRYNIQTGHVEAKLLDEDEKESTKPTHEELSEEQTESGAGHSRLQQMKKAVEEAMVDLENVEGKHKFQRWKHGDKEGIVNMKEGSFTKEELKEALKKFKHSDDENESAGEEKRKLRSLDQIKEELKDLQLNMKTDMEILREMYTEYQTEDLDVERKVHLLSEFDYHLHQIDNAINFVDIGGFDLVVRDLNHTSEEVRTGAALVLGTCTQSNPKVQVHAMKSGVLQRLIRMLSLEPTNTLRSRVLYAISCLIRHFPYAQQEFVNNGGVEALTQIFRQHGTDKLRLKAITLAVDLFDEKAYAEKHATVGNREQLEKLKQYTSVSLLETLIAHGWCNVIPELLAIPEHDTREKVLHAMNHMAFVCPDFVDDRWRMIALKTQYTKLSQEEALEEPNGYFHSLLKLIDEVSSKLDRLLRDEL